MNNKFTLVIYCLHIHIPIYVIPGFTWIIYCILDMFLQIKLGYMSYLFISNIILIHIKNNQKRKKTKDKMLLVENLLNTLKRVI